jgi:hypothetical protein
MEASLSKAIRRDFYELADKGENISGTARKSTMRSIASR